MLGKWYGHSCEVCMKTAWDLDKQVVHFQISSIFYDSLVRNFWNILLFCPLWGKMYEYQSPVCSSLSHGHEWQERLRSYFQLKDTREIWYLNWSIHPCLSPIRSVHFSHSVVSDSLRPHGLQHTRLPCPSPTPRVCPSSLLNWWCHPIISSSVVPFSHLQSFPASGSFLISQFLVSGGQSIGTSALASVLPMNIQDWFPLRLTDWIFLQSKVLSRVFSTPQFKSINSLVFSFLYSLTLTSKFAGILSAALSQHIIF